MEAMITSILTPESIVALLMLVGIEIILGVDNIIFLTVMVNRLPSSQQPKTRFMGLALAMLTRIALLFSLSWIVGLNHPILTVSHYTISGRKLILLVGGLFLIIKSIHEIALGFTAPSTAKEDNKPIKSANSQMLWLILLQIAFIDIVFSLDSVITAVGLVKELWVMVTAIVLATIVMMTAANPIGIFIKNNPPFKLLALSFLVLVGVSLVSEGLGYMFPKRYLYFAAGFSVVVELLNCRLAHKQTKNEKKLQVY
ncbi:MAG: TerC family protein [Endozoicomonas sp. (ex Botrylloides leachii)]|nr:TerC family protein [Endozoicomonas sp. (ex Botrylloides leachii)]